MGEWRMQLRSPPSRCLLVPPLGDRANALTVTCKIAPPMAGGVLRNTREGQRHHMHATSLAMITIDPPTLALRLRYLCEKGGNEEV